MQQELYHESENPGSNVLSAYVSYLSTLAKLHFLRPLEYQTSCFNDTAYTHTHQYSRLLPNLTPFHLYHLANLTANETSQIPLRCSDH